MVSPSGLGAWFSIRNFSIRNNSLQQKIEERAYLQKESVVESSTTEQHGAPIELELSLYYCLTYHCCDLNSITGLQIVSDNGLTLCFLEVPDCFGTGPLCSNDKDSKSERGLSLFSTHMILWNVYINIFQ